MAERRLWIRTMRKWFGRVVRVGLLVSVLTGCVTTTTSTPAEVTLAAPPVLPAASPTSAPIPSVTIPSLNPTKALSPTPTQVQLTATAVPGLRLASGWTLFSNPNFVNGVAIEHDRIWAATSGGVVSFNLETGQKQRFTPSDGLVDIQANDIVYCELPEERIIVAHETGVLSVYSLARQKWDQLPITFGDGSGLSGVRSLVCDSEGKRLVVGARDGLGILDLKTRVWKRLDEADGLALDDIRSVIMRGQTIWVAAGKVGGYLILGSTAYPLNRTSGFPVGEMNDVAWAQDGFVWLGYPTGLVRYKDRVWNSFTTETPRGIPFRSVNQVEIGTGDTVWIASATEGICPFDTTELQCRIIFPDPQDAPFTDLTSYAGGAVAGTNGDGLRVFEAEKVERLAFESNQLSSNQVYDFAEDANGQLWIATAHGVDILDPLLPQQPWQHIAASENKLMSPMVASLQPMANGMWFIYQNQRQASYFDGTAWKQFDSYKGISGVVLDSAIDQRGYIWFATDQGINVWDGITMRTFDSTVINQPTNRFQTLLAVNDEMWAGTDYGLLRYHKFAWENVLPGVSVQTIASDGTGALLVGTDQGLIRYADGQGYFWIINLGQEVYLAPSITAIELDQRGNIWVGSASDGLFLYNGETWQHFTTANGLPANRIQSIYVDHVGAVWVATLSGSGGGAVVRYMP